MKIRRVVTGHTPDGKATVASDSDVDASRSVCCLGRSSTVCGVPTKRQRFQMRVHLDPREPTFLPLADFALASSPSDQTR